MNKSNRRKFIGTAAALAVGTAATAMPLSNMKKIIRWYTMCFSG
ncbi:twin-arginine translocation signal domain-containing protein [Pedobacter panaciterrae]